MVRIAHVLKPRKEVIGVLGSVDNYGLCLIFCDYLFYILVKAILFDEIEVRQQGCMVRFEKFKF